MWSSTPLPIFGSENLSTEMHLIRLLQVAYHLSEAAGHEGHLPFWLEVINLKLSMLSHH